jgi:hypothetical protein
MTPAPPPRGGPAEPDPTGRDPAAPGRPDAAGAPRDPDRPERPPHGSLQPRGEDVAWSALGSLLAGPLVWGGVGLLADRWLGTSPALTVTGVVVGAITAFYIVYVRFGRGG